jgi:FPC/CPF motif-containing protein YcgG
VTSRRDYRGADDRRAMQRLVERLWTVDSNWHIGDLAVQRRTVPGVESTWRTGYPIAAELYQSIGFHPGPRTTTYRRTAPDPGAALGAKVNETVSFTSGSGVWCDG